MKTNRYEIVICKDCGKKLKRSRLKQYSFECKSCDTDYYSFETKKIIKRR